MLLFQDYSRGQTRQLRYHTALGSARETLACLELAARCCAVAPSAPLSAQLNRIILGKEQQMRLCISCLLARGHLLIEDIPGVGKYVSFYDTEGNRVSMLEPIARK